MRPAYPGRNQESERHEAVGAYREACSATGVSGDQSNSNAGDASAAYVISNLESAELNNDGAINGADLGLPLGQTGACDGYAADLNADGCVDATDVGLLLRASG